MQLLLALSYNTDNICLEHIMSTLTVSIVLYKNNLEEIKRCINSVNNSIKTKIFIIDNSPSRDLEDLKNFFENVEYIFNPTNPGYGAAHNIALREALKKNTKYHLVLNPDIYFEKKTIGVILDYMDKDNSIGLIMPKILYPNGDIQYLCKLVPSPFDLISRLFLWNKICLKNNYKFEMRNSNYDKKIFVPYLSGCFMLLRVDSLRHCGLFDERFFMYGEDIDLSRRIASYYQTIFYPNAIAYHKHEAASKKSIQMFVIHAINIIKYFNKWGWIFDSERKRLNGIATSD